MKIVRLADGSVGFVDRSHITKIFGAFFLFIGALPVPALFTAATSGMEGMHPIAVFFGACFALVGLLIGICFLNNWTETWVMMESKKVHVKGRFGFWKKEKMWGFDDGGVVKPWVKSNSFTKNITAGLNIESQGKVFEVIAGDATAFPKAMQLGPHLAKLLGIDFEDPEPNPEVQIYPALENRPEGSDPTHFFEELPDKNGRFAIAFGLLISSLVLLEPTNVILVFMTQGPAVLCVYFGLRVVRKFAQLKIDIQQGTMTYRWRNLFEHYQQDLPTDAIASILVTHWVSDNRAQSKYLVTLYFAEFSIQVFSAFSKDTIVKEVQERAWELANQLGCPLIVAVNKSLDMSERLAFAEESKTYE